MICGLCKDPLVKKPLLSPKQIIGVLTVTAFLAPLLVLIFFVVKSSSIEKLQNNSDSIVLLLSRK